MAGSYFVSNLVSIGVFSSFGDPHVISQASDSAGQATRFSTELVVGQTVSWIGNDSAAHTGVIQFIASSGTLSLVDPQPPAACAANVPLTAYYSADIFTSLPMRAADCKVFNLWNGAKNVSAGVNTVTGEGVNPVTGDPIDPRLSHGGFANWWSPGYDDSAWAPAVAVTPDPAWSVDLPLLSGSDYIWDRQVSNPVQPNESTNAAEQLLIRWRVTIPNTVHTNDSTNILFSATGARDEPVRSPPCILGDTLFTLRGNNLTAINGQVMWDGTIGTRWFDLIQSGPNLIAFLVNDATFLTYQAECPGALPWQPWISVPWFASGVQLHGFSIDVSHSLTMGLDATFAGSIVQGRSYAQVIGA